MSIGLTRENTTTAEAILVQYSGEDDVPQDDGENLVRLEEEEEE